MSEAGPRTLAHEVTDAFRIVLASAVAMVVVLSVALVWFTFAGDPATDRAAQIVSRSQAFEADLISEQSLLRAYVLTGDDSVLETLPQTEAGLSRARVALADVGIDGSTASIVKSLNAAEGAWQRGWVVQALDPNTRRSFISRTGALNAARLTGFVNQGEASFDAAQAAAQRLLEDGQREQAHARRVTAIAMIGTAGLLLMIGIAAAVATVRRRHRLDARVVGPVGVLLAKVQAAGRGEFGSLPVIDAPVELLELRDELADMSASLLRQQEALATRADDAAATARRLQLVVDFTREISDSLTLSNVLSALTAAGRRLIESPRARVWLVDDDAHTLRLRYDSITGDVVVATNHEVGEGALGRAAADRWLTYSEGLCGETSGASSKLLVAEVPLVKGARLVGVLEIALPAGAASLKEDTVAVLIATAAQASTAIDAALLYERSETLSRSDPLTGLHNRRQLDQDLELEVVRAARYGRPMTFFMVDIDRFKVVNDTYGHALGDNVLRGVAELLRDEMRAGDTVYRYGGEEFAVLARDTDATGGLEVGERLRRAIEKRFADPDDGEVSVTISVGLASLSIDTESAEDMINAADRALYAAKRSGRNRVVASNPDLPKPRPSEPPIYALP
jgi:diguanylate cyclase (GGDEF)-like protein